MANVPEQNVPSVAPDTRAPDDFQHIQATPEEFGGLIAKGAEQFGQGALQAARVFGKIQTDDAATSAMKQADTAVSNFRSLRGADALNAQASTQETIDTAFKQGREGLTTPEQQHDYDQATRAFQLRYISGMMATHADEQGKIYANNVHNDTANFHLGLIAQNPNDDTVFHDNMAEVARAREKQAIAEGRDLTGIQQAGAEGKAQALSARLQSMAVKDPAGALSFLDKNKDIASVVDKRSGVSYYDTLANEFRARADDQATATKAQTYWNTANANHPFANSTLPIWQHAATTAPDGFSPQGLARTIKIESGGNPNAVNGHAVGLGQFMPQTWEKYGQGDPKNPADAILATQRYAAANSAALTGVLGRQPSDAELYLAHQQGAEGATKLLLNPNARAGSLVGDAAIRSNGGDPNAPAFMFTNMWVGRFNGSQGWQSALGPGTLSDRPSMRADAYQMAMSDPELAQNPILLQRTLTHIHQMAAAQEIADDNNAKANKQIVEQAADEYTKVIHTGQATPEIVGKLVTDPRFNSDWKTRDALINLARAQSGNDIAGASMQYGPGFWSAYKGITAPLGDPSRISDPTALLNRGGPGGDLTLSGIQKLTQTMREMQKSVDDNAVHTAKAGLLSYAKGQLSFEADTGPIKIRDPKGEAIFNATFIPKFEAAYDNWVKDGKNPWEFLTRDNVDKLMTGLRSKSEMAMDKVTATGDATGDKVDQTIPVAPQGVAAPAWQEVMATRPIAPSGKPVAPQNWANALALIRSNPTPENIAAFNKVFPDFDANRILEKLGGTTATPHTATQPKPSASPAAAQTSEELPDPTILIFRSIFPHRALSGSYEGPSPEELTETERAHVEWAKTHPALSYPYEGPGPEELEKARQTYLAWAAAETKRQRAIAKQEAER